MSITSCGEQMTAEVSLCGMCEGKKEWISGLIDWSMTMFVFFLFSFIAVVCFSLCSPLTFSGQCEGGDLKRDVWWGSSGPSTYIDTHTQTHSVGAS